MPKPRMNEKQFNSLLGRVSQDEMAKLFLEFNRFPGFINDFHIGNVWNKLGKLLAGMKLAGRSGAWFDQHWEFRDALIETTAQCERLSARTLSNVLHGVANTGFRSLAIENMLVACASAMIPLLTTCDAQNVCNTVWGLATYGSEEPSLFTRPAVQQLFEAVAEQRTDDVVRTCNTPFAGQNVSNMVWSFAKAGWCADKLFRAVFERTDLLRQFNGQDMSNIVWSCATLGTGDGAYFAAVAAELVDREPGTISASHLATIAWAFGKCKQSVPWLFDYIAQTIELRGLDARGLSQVIWGFSSTGFKCPPMYERLADEIIPRLHELSEQNISMVAWSYANAEHSAPRLFDALAVESEKRADHFSEVQCASIVWSFGKAKLGHRLLERLARDLSRDDELTSWSAGHLAMLCFGFATGGVREERLFEALRRATEPKLQEFSRKELAMLSWGFAGHRAPPGLAELAADAVKETDEDHEESARSFSMAVWSQGAADPKSFTFKAYFEKAAAQTYRLLPHFDKPSLVHLSAGFANAYGKRHYDPPEVDWTNIGEVRPPPPPPPTHPHPHLPSPARSNCACQQQCVALTPRPGNDRSSPPLRSTASSEETASRPATWSC